MNKLFVLIRNDMPIAYQGVQAGHAVAKFMLDHPGKWNNEILVYLNVSNEKMLKLWKYKFENKFFDFSCFHEPDLNNEMTALSVMCSDSLVAKLNLMGSE